MRVQGMCKKVIVAAFKVPPQRFPGETEKTGGNLRMVDVLEQLLPPGPDVVCDKKN
jgi:hypothetical protein